MHDYGFGPCCMQLLDCFNGGRGYGQHGCKFWNGVVIRMHHARGATPLQITYALPAINLKSTHQISKSAHHNLQISNQLTIRITHKLSLKPCLDL